MYRNIECCVIGTNSVVCPTSEVRGRSWEDPMPEGWRPKGVTPRPRSGAVAQSTRLQRRRNSREELPCIRGRGGGRRPRGDTQRLRPGAAAGSRYPTPQARGQGRQVGGATPRPPCPRPGAVAGRTNPTSKEPWLRGCRRA